MYDDPDYLDDLEEEFALTPIEAHKLYVQGLVSYETYLDVLESWNPVSKEYDEHLLKIWKVARWYLLFLALACLSLLLWG